jgi:AraC-like DNA-binding protein
MILTELPDLPPRPETPANAAFRRDYVARWSRENLVLCGQTRYAEYPRVMHPLSIKMAWGGSEVYRLRRRDVHVRAGRYLVLNDGDEYGSTLRSERPTTSFSVFLRRGLADEVIAARRLGVERCMEQAIDAPAPASFSPHLRADDRHVTPRMRYIHARVLAGERSQAWLDEQAVLLVGDLVRAEEESFAGTLGLPAVKASTRAELARRLRLAADYIESHFEQPLPLEAMAQVACMSTYHFVRYFALLHGITPHAYLVRRRTEAARQLLAEGCTDLAQVAERTGFGSRSSLYRALGARAPARRRRGRREELPPERARAGSGGGMLAAMPSAHSEFVDADLPWRQRLLEVPEDVPRSAWYGRIAAFLLFAIWGTGVVFSRMTDTPTLLHLTVILFHEAGHVIFSPFGEALRVAGGTLGQLLMPLVCAVALHRHGDNFGAAIGLAWLSLSGIDTSIYAYDAFDPVLP